MKRTKDATLVICLFVVYCVLLSQGLKASAASAFFGALAALPLTVPLYRKLWPLPPEKAGGERSPPPGLGREAAEAAGAPGRGEGRSGHEAGAARPRRTAAQGKRRRQEDDGAWKR